MKRIFVFGSNLAGRHGKGSAEHARLFYGAKRGVPEGMEGMSYAIPTKDINLEPLPLDVIEQHVAKFLEYARVNPNLIFDIVPIGCGLAEYKFEDIAPFSREPLTTVGFLKNSPPVGNEANIPF